MNFFTKTVAALAAVSAIAATVPGAQAGSFRDNAETQANYWQGRRELCSALYQNAPISINQSGAYELANGDIIKVTQERKWVNDMYVYDCTAMKYGTIDEVATVYHTYGQVTWELGWDLYSPRNGREEWRLHAYYRNGSSELKGELRYGRFLDDAQAQEGLDLLNQTFGF